MEDEITKTCKTFALTNFNQEKNLIDAIKQNCRKIIREKTGKKPFTNVNIASNLMSITGSIVVFVLFGGLFFLQPYLLE